MARNIVEIVLKAQDEASAVLGKSENRLKKFGANVGKIAVGLGAGMLAAGAAAFKLAQSVANTADELRKTSQAIGLPIEQLSALRHAADLSGMKMKEFDTGIRTMARSMSEARDGIATYADAYEALGVQVTDTETGALRPSLDVMMDVADQFAEMEDGAQKTAIAMDIFGGRAGPKLIPMLNVGREGISAMMEEAKKLGIVIGEEMAKEAEEFNDSFTRLGAALKGVKILIARDLIPAITPLIKQITTLIQNNKELLGQNLRGFFEAITPVILTFIKALTWLLKAYVDLTKPGNPIERALFLFQDFVNFIISIPERLAAIPKAMFDLGKNIVGEIIRGITAGAKAILDALKRVLGPLRRLLPFSPAVEGPLVGLREAGANIVLEVVGGMAREGPTLKGAFASMAMAFKTDFEEPVLAGARNVSAAVAQAAAAAALPAPGPAPSGAPAGVQPLQQLPSAGALPPQGTLVPKEGMPGFYYWYVGGIQQGGLLSGPIPPGWSVLDVPYPGPKLGGGRQQVTSRGGLGGLPRFQEGGVSPGGLVHTEPGELMIPREKAGAIGGTTIQVGPVIVQESSITAEQLIMSIRHGLSLFSRTGELDQVVERAALRRPTRTL